MYTGYLIIALFLLGIWGILQKRNLIKKVIALNIINSSIIILFLYAGSLSGKNAPILVKGISDIVDPLPQALMLTAIVVGICLTALALALVYKIYQRYHTLDIAQIETIIRQEDE
jgi:multicomponent Na+:H+ antiporter subunit C